MKKVFLLGVFFACLAGNIQAEEISIGQVTLTANQTADVEVLLTNERSDIGAIQFDMYLPEGVTIDEDEYGPLYEMTDRLKIGRSEYFSFACVNKTDHYTFQIYTNKKNGVSGNAGAIFSVTLKADDKIATQDNLIKLKKVSMATIATSSDPSVDIYQDDAQFECTLQIPAKIGKSGYGSFSWPLALDFTDTGVTVFAGTRNDAGILHLEPLADGKVPENTGVILKGSANTTVYPMTTDDVVASPVNDLVGTADGEVESDGTSFYALATKPSGAGFFCVNSGVIIPKYKAYLKVSGNDASASEGFYFDETNGIGGITTDSQETDSYTLTGIKVKTMQQKGIYIKNGKKVVKK